MNNDSAGGISFLRFALEGRRRAQRGKKSNAKVDRKHIEIT